MVVNSCFFSVTPHSQISNDSTANACQLTIRAADKRDLHRLAQLLSDSFHPPEGLKALLYPFLKLGIHEDLRSRIKSSSPDYICLVAVAPVVTAAGKREEVAGTIEMTLSSSNIWLRGRNRSTYISNLAVHPSYRRQGIARKLLRRCEQTTLEWGFKEISLHVLEDNHQARQLYLSSGYQLRRFEPSCSAWFFQRPRRLLLHKRMSN
ncbi:MAG: GNAT family N-acetyltransferase [Cyanobacteria bacterium QS_4_48_99]|nr:MAG: GNAT family N-acetyltransferase [Cyanobacteria bacterium QS_4_48_99]PSP07593.1 MAG: GNAT family N-acetyltransferase [Cyanobacteria bacterium SW_7_48_12]